MIFYVLILGSPGCLETAVPIVFLFDSSANFNAEPCLFLTSLIVV